MPASARILIAAAVASVAIAASAATLAATHTSPTVRPVDQLFVLRGHHGVLISKHGGGPFRPVVPPLGRRVDSACCLSRRHPRGKRVERPIPTRGFLRSWAGFGFHHHHPGAVLVPDRTAVGGGGAVAIRLRPPLFRNHGR